MTPGINGETADGMSLAKIGRIIDALRHERYRFQPVKRKYSEIAWLPMSRIASTSTNADRLTGLPNTYSQTGLHPEKERKQNAAARAAVMVR